LVKYDPGLCPFLVYAIDEKLGDAIHRDILWYRICANWHRVREQFHLASWIAKMNHQVPGKIG